MRKILKPLSPAVLTLALMSSLPHVALAAYYTPTHDSYGRPEEIASEQQLKVAILNNGVMEVHDSFESAVQSLIERYGLSQVNKSQIGRYVESARASGVAVVYIEPRTINGVQTYVISYPKPTGHVENNIVHPTTISRPAAQKHLKDLIEGQKGFDRMNRLNEQYTALRSTNTMPGGGSGGGGNSSGGGGGSTPFGPIPAYKLPPEQQLKVLNGIVAEAKLGMNSEQTDALYRRVRQLTGLDKETRLSAEDVISRKVAGDNKRSGKRKPPKSERRGSRGIHKASEKQKTEQKDQERSSFLSNLKERLFGKRSDAKKDSRQAQRQRTNREQ